MISFANLLCVVIIYLAKLWIFPGYSYEFNSLCAMRDITVFVTLKNMKYTCPRTKIKENHEETLLFIIFSFISVYL